MTKEIKKASDSVDFLYAKGNIVNLGEHPRYVEKVLTNRPSLDFLSGGGFPKGRLILLAGEKSSGKSSLAIQLSDLIGKKILYIDTEATLTTDYLNDLDVDPSKYDHSIPESIEQACNIIRKQIPNYDVIVFDSINNTASEEQIQKSAEERTMANRAIVLSAQLPIIISLCNQYNTTLIMISQVRQNLDRKNPYSPLTTIPGGESLHHNSSMTIELQPSTKKKSKETDELDLYDTVSGRMIRMSCTKNKVGKPFRVVELEFTYGRGFTVESDIASSALRLGILEKSGSWIKYKGTSIAQGIDNVVPVLTDNPELLEEITQEINEKTQHELNKTQK